jgi:UDP-glucose 4-epimerase
MKILITGGAGYIGSHCVKQLQVRGHQPVVFDNLSTGHRQALDSSVPLIEGDLRDYDAMLAALLSVRPDVVMHFAGLALVPESMRAPELYFDVNTTGGHLLLKAMLAANVRRIVVSSTCATYGVPTSLPIRETDRQAPINPYGTSKLLFEQMLAWYQQIHQFHPVIFRYFNAAGAWDELGEDHEPETHLIPNVLRVALGRKAEVQVFGTDYDTPDGSCLRDYIHVRDVANAHVLAAETGQCGTFNLGTGQPVSVLEIIEHCRRVSGHAIPAMLSPRRAGDPSALYADPTAAKQSLGWQPEFSDPARIIADAWAWHQRHPMGFV